MGQKDTGEPTLTPRLVSGSFLLGLLANCSERSQAPPETQTPSKSKRESADHSNYFGSLINFLSLGLTL